MKFTETQLEKAFVELLEQEGFQHSVGATLAATRKPDEVLIEADLHSFLLSQYAAQGITGNEIKSIILQLKSLPDSDLYESNKTFCKMLSDGRILKREDRNQKDIYIQFIDYSGLNKQRQAEAEHLMSVVAEPQAEYSTDNNIYRFVTQLEIVGTEPRKPDGIVYINGLPLVVFEFKSAIREDATIHDAFKQLTVRYRRDIPELFKYNAFCVISDGVNNKAGSFFASYEFFYAWRRVAGLAKDVDGIDSMFTLIQGMFHKNMLRDIIRNFIYIPDSSPNEKIVCRYPQYYAARALFDNIKLAQKPNGNGKGGTYFGATGCGKSYTMLYLTRLLMKSEYFESPTIVLITDRTDLDDQLSGQFINAKNFIGDSTVMSVESRAQLRELLQGKPSGGVFLTTIHKFNEDIELLTDRTNVICISDEAHRSQVNLDQKVRVTEKGVNKTFGFAKYLHDSLPNATFVGFTGTPIDATLDVFGKVIDSYTMTESVKDEITVRIVYEGRAAKVVLNNNELDKIEKYYAKAAEIGANEHQIEQSKKESASMFAILGDPKRLKAVAEDFVKHYEKRVSEGSTVKGKAMFVCSTREIAYELYKNIVALKPEWLRIALADSPEQEAELTDKEKRELKPIERIKLIATRGQDDPKEMYDLLGTKEHRKKLDSQFKNEKSNFKIAIVVDMWLTGFDVPFLDSIYIDKPIQRHNLIQTISRVNRKFEGKNKGLVVDYIGIKTQMNLALKQYSEGDKDNFEDIAESIIIVRNHLDLLAKLFHTFDSTKYFNGTALQQLNTLNLAADYAQSINLETRFMGFVKRLKAAYDICAGSEQLTELERDSTHFYLAVRSIVFKITKGNAPDTEQMNARVREMIKEALQSEGVEEILKLGSETEQDIFDKDYLAKIDKIKLPNTKIKLLQQLLAKVIAEIKKVNRVKGIDFSKKMQDLVERYNDRDANDILKSEVYEEMANALTDLIWEVHKEFSAGDELGIDFQEKAFYDILKQLCIKYDFKYPDNKMIELAKAVKNLVDGQAKFPDWDKREDIKSALKVGLILLLDEFGYPPVERDEVYVEIFEQAENFKKNNKKQ